MKEATATIFELSYTAPDSEAGKISRRADKGPLPSVLFAGAESPGTDNSIDLFSPGAQERVTSNS